MIELKARVRGTSDDMLSFIVDVFWRDRKHTLTVQADSESKAEISALRQFAASSDFR